MRRIVFIIISLVGILVLGCFIFFGLKSPEMPIKEVHKILVVSPSKSTLDSIMPEVSSIQVPSNNDSKISPSIHPATPKKELSSNLSSVPIIIPPSNIPAAVSATSSIQTSKENQPQSSSPK